MWMRHASDCMAKQSIMMGIEYFSPDWWEEAKCLGKGLRPFYGYDPIDKPDLHHARYLCGRCPVLTKCMSYSFKMKEKHGIWAGLTANERSNHLKKLREGSTIEFEVFSAMRNNRHWIMLDIVNWRAS